MWKRLSTVGRKHIQESDATAAPPQSRADMSTYHDDIHHQVLNTAKSTDTQGGDEPTGRVRPGPTQYPSDHDSGSTYTASPGISPPSSPIVVGYNPDTNHGDVSPIDNEPPVSRLTRLPSRRDKVFPQLRSTSGTGPTKWDKYTGERTTKDSGKTATSHNTDLPIHKILAQMQKSKLAKKSNVTSSPESTLDTLPSQQRPPWRGASGRQADVPPILSSPSPRATIRPSQETVPEPNAPINSQPQFENKKESSGVLEAKTDQPTTTSSTRPDSSYSHTTISNLPESTPTIERDYPAETASFASFASSRPSSIISRKALPASSSVARIHQIQDSDMEQPSSHFSWTTTGTNSTHRTRDMYPARRESFQPPPLPVNDYEFTTSEPANYDTGSDMTRSPAIYHRDSESSGSRTPPPIIASKTRDPRANRPTSSPQRSEWEFSTPTPSIHSTYTPSLTPSTATTALGKALPLPPPALTAETLIEELEARMADLSAQKRNLLRVKRDFEASEPENPVVTGFQERREKERQRGVWRVELEEIEMAEHEVGVRLHRAWRRRERDEGSEGTGLWVRRVTR